MLIEVNNMTAISNNAFHTLLLLMLIKDNSKLKIFGLMLTANVECQSSHALDKLRKGDFEELHQLINDPSLATRLVELMSLIFQQDSLPMAIMSDVVRTIQKQLLEITDAPGLILCLLQSILSVALEGKKLQSTFIEMIPNLLIKLADSDDALDLGGDVTGIKLAIGFLEKFINTPIHPENLIHLLVSLRDIVWSPNEGNIKVVLKLIEDAPLNVMPSIFYQLLLWCSETPSMHRACFETIFILIEGKRSILDLSECLSSVRLALQHKVKLLESFTKVVKEMLLETNEPSPAMILLLLFVGSNDTEQEKHVKLVQQYIIETKLTESQASIDRELASQMEFSLWPKIDRLVVKLLEIVPPNDECYIIAIFDLAIGLITKEFEDHNIPKLLLNGLYQKCVLARMAILSGLVSQIVLAGNMHTRPTWIHTAISCLEGLCILDNGITMQALLKKGCHFSFFKTLESIKENNNYPLGLIKVLGSAQLTTTNEHLSLGDSLALSDNFLANIFYSCPTVVLMAILSNIDASLLSSPFNFFLLEKSCQIVTHKEQFYDLMLEKLPSPIVFNFLFQSFKRLSTDLTNWPLIVKKCLSEESRPLKVIEPLPLILRVLISLDHNNIGDECAIFIGIINNLCESLASQIDWSLGSRSNDPIFQQAIRPIIIGLYDIAIKYCINGKELEGKAIIDTCLKILENRIAFIKSSEIPSIEYEIIDLADVCKVCTILNSLSIESTYNLSLKTFSLLIECSWTSQPQIGVLMPELFSMLKRLLQGEQDRSQSFKIHSSIISKIHVIFGKSKLQLDASNISTLTVHLKLMVDKACPVKDLIAIAEILKAQGVKDFVGLEDICRHFSCDTEMEASFIKLLFGMALCMERTEFLQTLCSDLLLVLGGGQHQSEDEMNPQKRLQQIRIKAISGKSAESILSLLLGKMNAALKHCGELLDSVSKLARWSPRDTNRIISFITKRLYVVASCCNIISSIAVCGSNYISLAKLLSDLYKLASILCKSVKSTLSDEFKGLAQLLVGELIKNIYEMLPTVQQAEIEKVQELVTHKKKRQKIMKSINSYISRESRLIPQLIFQIEAFERDILTLGEKMGEAAVTSFYRSTARDFKIQMHELENVLDEKLPEEEDEEGGEGSNGSQSSDTSDPQEMSLAISTMAMEE